MKKIILTIGILLSIVLVSAAVYNFSISNVELTPNAPKNITPDTISYSCDGVAHYVEHYEKRWDSNDIASVTKQNCSGTITNIQKDGEYWQKNKYGLESFSVEELKTDECRRNQNKTLYDSKINDCVAPPEPEENLGEGI